MIKRSPSWVLFVAVWGVGCVFTTRPQLPLEDGGGGVDDAMVSVFDDASRGQDAAAPPPEDVSAVVDSPAPPDISAPAADAASDAGINADQCVQRTTDAGDGGDAGFFNERGEPCDPTASPRDGGRDASDADASDAGEAGASDAGASDAGASDAGATEAGAGDVSDAGVTGG